MTLWGIISFLVLICISTNTMLKDFQAKMSAGSFETRLGVGRSSSSLVSVTFPSCPDFTSGAHQ